MVLFLPISFSTFDTKMDIEYLIMLLLIHGSLSFSHDESSIHELFYLKRIANDTHVYYRHNLVINRIAQLPCHQKNLATVPKFGNFYYEWLMNGQQIHPQTPFLRASWDLNGYLTILQAMRRSYTLWCHMVYGNVTVVVDYYFEHKISFFEVPTVHVVLGLTVSFTMPNSDSVETKCSWEKHTCDCRQKSGDEVKEMVGKALNSHFVKDKVTKEVLDRLRDMNGMEGDAIEEDETDVKFNVFSVDDFSCVTEEAEGRSLYYMEFSTLLGDEKRYSESEFKSVTEVIQDLKHDLTLAMEEVNEEIAVIARNTFSGPVENISCTLYERSYRYCVGPSGKLDSESKGCDLCPPGYYAPNHIVIPALPVTWDLFTELRGANPRLSDQFAKEAGLFGWFGNEKRDECIPCPINTFTEESGRSVCLNCPVWHAEPQENKANISRPHGAGWVHEACPKEGREEVRLIQVARGALGDRFAEWFHDASPMTRNALLVAIFGVPFVIALMLVFYAYALLDVGSFMISMVQKMSPVEVQIAETAIAAAQLEAEQKKASEEVAARTRGLM
ncbi:unnamed protein product [Calicophoron daubneyi]|uniref:Tyrosine-protein kinase ephrin type A/B receptor-like domain-containing protein n=1 Tax=Calicophoron daubneyi TaxID=300641 RepID=A0AAV2TJA0_CALDB